MRTINIDFSKICGEIKPLHGVNSGPCTNLASGNWCINHIEDFKKAGIPYSRLHDTEGSYGGTYFVDIPNIFRNFDKDPEDPAAYDFDMTDEYISKIYEAGTKVFYRLGVTIDHAKIKKRAFMPKDNLKWSKICEGIIRHYNEGWANGYHYNIEYWEIWNEPDNLLSPSPMWSGTAEDYYRLYEVSSNYLKKRFPNIKIGGPGDGICWETRATEDCDSKKFYHGFLKYLTSDEHKSPFDFLDIHIYTLDIDEIGAVAFQAKKLLEDYGLIDTEIIMGEYNFGAESKSVKSPRAAAALAGALCVMQKSPMSKAMYYDAQPSRINYCGLFSYPEYGIEKPYYSLETFNELYKLKKEVYNDCSETNIYTAAAFDGEKGAILITRYDIEDLMMKPNYIVKDDGCPEHTDRPFPIELLERNERISLPLNLFLNIKGIPEKCRLKLEYYLIDENNSLTQVRTSSDYRPEIHPEILKINSQSTLLIKAETIKDSKIANTAAIKAAGFMD